MATRASNALDDFLSAVTDRLAEAEVAGFGEVGLRLRARCNWVHCARTDKYTLITCYHKRGTKGIDDARVLS